MLLETKYNSIEATNPETRERLSVSRRGLAREVDAATEGVVLWKLCLGTNITNPGELIRDAIEAGIK